MKIDASRHVNASPDAVWSVLTDVPAAYQTLRGVVAVEVLTPGPYRPGFRWRETRRTFGMKATEEMMVTIAEPPHTTTVVAENGGTEYTTVLTVSPDADGGSTLRLEFTTEVRHAPAVARVATALMGRVAEKASRRAVEQDLADIAAEAERRAG